MTNEIRQRYNKAVELAEAGQYEEAIQEMKAYLKAFPQDGEALNDAGTILFCMNRSQEAICYFQQACSYATGDMLSQVHFNLCEAYISEGLAVQAAELIGDMQTAGTLTTDTVNRIAQAFIAHHELGKAIEMLLLSLELFADQEILEPMIQIIKSKRPSLALIGQTDCRIQVWKAYLEQRFRLRTCTEETMDQVSVVLGESDIVIFSGCGPVVSQAISIAANRARIVLLSPEDFNSAYLNQIRWDQIDLLGLPSGASAEVVSELSGADSFVGQTFILPPSTNIEAIEFKQRKTGKKMAALGPWNLKRNPMFLLQCIQKLYYLDPDVRLYLAGEFEDPQLERYIQYMIEEMDLDTVVFLDPTPKNLNRWLRDKQFIVSTSIDSEGIENVHAGMAAGLKPVVHRFCDAEEFMDKQWLFTLAEDFCQLVGSSCYQSHQYRQFILDHFDPGKICGLLDQVMQLVERKIFQDQKQLSLSTVPGAAVQPVRQDWKADSLSEKPLSRRRIEPVSVSETIPCVTETKVIAELPDTSIDQIAKQALHAAKQLQEITRPSPIPVESVSD